MSAETKLKMKEYSPNEVSPIKQATRESCVAASMTRLMDGAVFKYQSKLLHFTAAIGRFYGQSVTQGRISMAGLIGGSRTLSGCGMMIIFIFCYACGDSPVTAATLHEQLLASDPVLKQVDDTHAAAYRLLRNSLDKGDQQQLKNAQIKWIDSLNQTLAQTPAFQRRQVVMQWTLERTRYLNGTYDLRNGRTQNSNIPELPKPFAQSPYIPREVPDQSQQAEVRTTALAAALTTDIANHWKTEDDASDKLPEGLPNALVDRLEQLVPWSKIDNSGVAKGRYPNLKLAYAVHNALIAKPLNLTSLAELLDQGRNLSMEEVPWIGIFSRILEKCRAKAILLQEEALSLLKDGDAQAAEARLEQAIKTYPSESLVAYSAALVSYDKLIQDKSLRAVDGDWKKPSLLDKELMAKACGQVTALRAFQGKEVLPALSSLAKGLEAAGILGKFTSDYEPAGNMDQPHPIRALQAMRNSEKYRDLKSNDSIFTKPFVDRMKLLEELIGPKTKDYEKLVEQASVLEKEGKYLDAASAFRLAMGIEYSKELEQTIHRCEAKTSGL